MKRESRLNEVKHNVKPQIKSSEQKACTAVKFNYWSLNIYTFLYTSEGIHLNIKLKTNAEMTQLKFHTPLNRREPKGNYKMTKPTKSKPTVQGVAKRNLVENSVTIETQNIRSRVKNEKKILCIIKMTMELPS